MHTKLSTKHKLRHFFSGTLLWRLLHFFDCTNTKKAKLDQKALRTYLVVDMKELLNTLFLGYLFVAWWGATVPWRSTFVYAVMVCRFFLLSFYTIFSMILFSGLLCLPFQPIWLLRHVDQYHGACPDQLRNYAATGHVSVTLHSSVENVQSDAVSQVFNWKSLKSF